MFVTIPYYLLQQSIWFFLGEQLRVNILLNVKKNNAYLFGILLIYCYAHGL